VVGSHDANDRPWPEYIEAQLSAGIYDEKGDLKEGLLDSECIEAREWNLSAAQYKPFDFTTLRGDKSVSQLIDELRESERHIMGALGRLLELVEGR
jgi:type I restriction enzyme M protein